MDWDDIDSSEIRLVFPFHFCWISGRCCKGHTVDNTCLSRNFLQFIGGFFTGLATCSCAKILCKDDLLESALKIQILRLDLRRLLSTTDEQSFIPLCKLDSVAGYDVHKYLISV